jgi:hypothetical protein
MRASACGKTTGPVVRVRGWLTCAASLYQLSAICRPGFKSFPLPRVSIRFSRNELFIIRPAGVVTQFQLVSPSGPQDIVAGADGNLRFTKHTPTSSR